jgi:hypothetical protein
VTLLLLTLLSACYVKKVEVPIADRSYFNHPTCENRRMEIIPCKEFDLRAHMGGGPPSVEVVPGTITAIPEYQTMGVLGSFGAGAYISAGGMYPLTPIFGGVVLFPVVFIADRVIKKGMNEKKDAIMKVVLEKDLPGRLAERLTFRMNSALSGQKQLDIRLVVTINGYGIRENPCPMSPLPGEPSEMGGEFCFFFDGSLAVKKQDRTLFEDLIRIDRFTRSMDAPSARCAGLSALAADNGKVAGEIVEQATSVLVEIIARRVGVSP